MKEMVDVPLPLLYISGRLKSLFNISIRDPIDSYLARCRNCIGGEKKGRKAWQPPTTL